MPTMWPWSFRRVFGDYRRDSPNWDALARHDRDAGRETPSMPVYGIDRRPAEQAFVNRPTGCTFCYPGSGEVLRGRPGSFTGWR